ncbi:MAG: type II secretion system protein [Planctomycetes bacterium]|nr:type II secretion system protein [Planctomycetota bacterium]
MRGAAEKGTKARRHEGTQGSTAFQAVIENPGTTARSHGATQGSTAFQAVIEHPGTKARRHGATQGSTAFQAVIEHPGTQARSHGATQGISEPQAPARGAGCECALTPALSRSTGRGSRTTALQARPRGFTLIELLVVIAILVLLAGLIASGASRLFNQQKIRSTQQTMSNILLAIDNFSRENPLRLRYDRREGATFGAYPPYMLANRSFPVPTPIARVADLFDGDIDVRGDYTLTYRLGRDLGDTTPANSGATNWVALASTPQDSVNDDNRSLYAYLAAYSPASLELVSERARQPLSSAAEYVNLRGDGTTTTNPNRRDVLGFVDAWGVPLDYALYVKVDWGATRNLGNGVPTTGFRVIDRVPMLRSHGIEREKYDQWVNSNSQNPSQRVASLLDPAREILTGELPKPFARLATADLSANPQIGILDDSNSGQQRAAGWLKLVAGGYHAGGVFQEDSKYRPN